MRRFIGLINVIAGAAKLGIAVNVGHMWSVRQYYGECITPPATEGISDEWLASLSTDEDALMHQLRAALMQARDIRPTPPTSLFGLQAMTPEKADNPAIQECLDAVTEHQRYRSLMKGDWGRALFLSAVCVLTTPFIEFESWQTEPVQNSSIGQDMELIRSGL